MKRIICNKCGKYLNEIELLNYNHQFIFSFGYSSARDGEVVNFDLCNECLDNILNEIVKTFVFVPEGLGVDSYTKMTPQQHQEVFDEWKKTGIWNDLKYR